MIIGEVINGRFYMHDFEVYYKSAARFVQGQELYRIKADGHFVFKYAPTSAFYFFPLSLLPYSVANVIYWLLLTLSLSLILNSFYKITSGGDKVTSKLEEEQYSFRQKNVVMLLTFLTIITHFHRELHLGQVNLLLLALFVFTLQNIIQKNNKIAGFLLAISLFIKPFGLIFMPYLFLKKRFRAFFYTLIFLLVLCLLPLLFYPSLTTFKELYLSWFQELAIELKAKQSLLQAGNHTIFSVLARYTPLQYLMGNAMAARVYQVILLVLAGLAFLYFTWLGRHLKQPLVAEGAILICLIPLFAVTSMNAFLFSVPTILFLLYHTPRLPGWGKVALAIACILIGGNNYDLVGRRVYDILEDNSVYTFGALMALALMFYLRHKLVAGQETVPVGKTAFSTGEQLVN